MTALPKLIHRYSAVPVKIPAGLVTEDDRLILKLIQIFKGPRKTKTKLEDSTFLDFRTYYKATINKTVCFLSRNKHIEQRKRESWQSRNKSLYSGQLIFEKGAKTIQFEKSLSTVDANCLAIYMQKNELGPLSHITHKNQPKDLNVIVKAIKL